MGSQRGCRLGCEARGSNCCVRLSAQGCCLPYLGCVRLVRVRFAALLDEAVVGRVGSQRRGGRHQHSKHSASREAAGDTMSLAASVSVLWRCPTLPQPIGCSTIGAAGLSFQVRNVAGRFPGAVTTTSLCVQHVPPLFACVGVWVDRGSYSGCGSSLFAACCCTRTRGVGCCLVLAH